MKYQRPEAAVLGNAADLIQSDKSLSSESALEAQQIVPDAEFGE